MPIAPIGEKRPADVIANTVHVMKVPTGEIEETYVNVGQRQGGRMGGRTRADSLGTERRSQIAKPGVAARWGSQT